MDKDKNILYCNACFKMTHHEIKNRGFKTDRNIKTVFLGLIEIFFGKGFECTVCGNKFSENDSDAL